jgi:hypothetical protein
MSIGTILLIVLVVILLGVLPVIAARSQLGLWSERNRRRDRCDLDRLSLDGPPAVPRLAGRVAGLGLLAQEHP